MKNKEKYYDAILEALITDETCEFKQAYIFKSQVNGCGDVRCSQCEETTKQWLEAEYKEPIRLKKNEKAILESVDKRFKFIYREDYIYLKLSNGNKIERTFFPFNNLFQFIKVGEEPYSIEDLLKCEVCD